MGTEFAGARARLVFDIRLEAQARESRLVIRMSADASGPSGRIALLMFQFIGENAGVRGKELASRWRRTAIEDGMLPDQLL